MRERRSNFIRYFSRGKNRCVGVVGNNNYSGRWANNEKNTIVSRTESRRGEVWFETKIRSEKTSISSGLGLSPPNQSIIKRLPFEKKIYILEKLKALNSGLSSLKSEFRNLLFFHLFCSMLSPFKNVSVSLRFQINNLTSYFYFFFPLNICIDSNTFRRYILYTGRLSTINN